MRHLRPERIAAAEAFLWHAARLLERLRFEHLFRGQSPARALAALRPYQNEDGGFGQLLEPDFRGPVSQPLCVDLALRVLDELGLFEPALVQPAVAYLARIAAPDGGVPSVLASATAYPRAPWWEPDPAQPGCLLPSASIAGLLRKHRVEHPWIDGAEALTWRALETLPARLRESTTRMALLQVLYETRAGLTFLDHARDRTRAERTAAQLGSVLQEAGIFAEEACEAEARAVLDFAPHPEALARRWFEDATITRHLDALVDAQQEDGGFTVTWPAFTPLAGSEWRGIQTVEQLKTLRAYGRIQAA